MKECLSNLLQYGLFQYETAKIVKVNSRAVGSVYRLLQVIIIGFVLGWIFWKSKGYQEFDEVVSGVTTKVKGVQLTNLSGTGDGVRIWDVADFVVPPLENGAFFITTNAAVTKDQRQGACDEDPGVAPCQTNADCPSGQPQMLGNGVNTGRCVNSTQRPGAKSCEILAWCPVELDQLPVPGASIFPDAVNFTVLIKNSIEFPMFGVKRRNIQEYQNASYLKACRYDPTQDRLCPTFRIGDILALAGVANSSDITVNGGVVSIHINWECNLDLHESNCNPTYSFRRLDNPGALLARGWNFRYANYYQRNGTDYRTLVKAYGIRFVIFVTGQAGKFNVVPLARNIGSSMALLAIATIICDAALLYCTCGEQRNHYHRGKYELLSDKEGASRTLQASSRGDRDDQDQGRRLVSDDRDSPGNYGAVIA